MFHFVKRFGIINKTEVQVVMLWTIRHRDVELLTLLSNEGHPWSLRGLTRICNVSPYDCLLLNTSYVWIVAIRYGIL